MRLGFSIFALLALVPLAGSGRAQGPGQLVPVQRSEKAAVSRLDTRTFINPIDTRLTVKPPRPANPTEPPDFVFQSNNLPVGRVLPLLGRQERGGLWPAVGATGWYPPDPDLAVGSNHVVAVVNSSIAFFTKSGTKQFQQTAGSFFSGLAVDTFIFDPKCFYDRVHDRFVLVFLEQDDATQLSKLLLAVSDDGDPNGTWYRYRIESKLTYNGSTYWLDYPGFGYNKDAYVVSGNMFGFVSGFAGAQFVVIPSAPLLSGQPATSVSIHDPGSSSVQIADMMDINREVVFGASRSSSTTIKLFAIQNPGTLSPTLVSSNVTVPSNSSPTGPAPSTSGRTLSTVDGRVFNAAWRNGRLVTGHTTAVSGINAVRWYELNTSTWPESGAPSLVQAGNIASSAEHYFTPAIGINSQGAISVLFTASSSTLTADIRIASRAATDPLGAMSTPTTLESSVGNNYPDGRWGDYFGVDVDPSDDTTFWGIGESVSSTNAWRTSVFNWNVSSPTNTAPSVTITAPTSGSTFTSGSLITFTGSATDVQDGNLSSALVWTSSLQGVLGNGPIFSRSDLVVGTHVITASATDSGSLTGTATTTITVQSLSSPPAAPSNLAVAKQSAGVARLTWIDNANNETSFEVQREKKSGGNWINPTTITAGANTTTLGNAAGSGSFRYRIRSVNASGASSWTAWVNSPRL